MLEWRVTVDTIGVKWPKQNTSSANQEGIQQIPSRKMSGARTIVPILWASEREREIELRRTCTVIRAARRIPETSSRT